MSTLLVTGGAGFIGSHSVDRLLQDGHRVVVLDNFRTGRRENLRQALRAPYCQLIEADVSDEAALESVFQQYAFDGVIHLAALVSVPESFAEPALNYRLNIHSTELIARQCIQHHCPRLVFASSAAVYGERASLPNQESALPDPVSPYAAAKIASEYLLAGYQAGFPLQTICLRYFNVYGPRQNPGSPYSGVLSIFARRFADGLPVTIHADGEQTRDFISVQDVALINAQAATLDGITGGVFNVCTGRTITLNEILAVFREAYPGSPEPHYQATRKGDIRHSRGDPQKLRTALGISANISIQEGLGELIRWYREHTC